MYKYQELYQLKKIVNLFSCIESILAIYWQKMGAFASS